MRETNARCVRLVTVTWNYIWTTHPLRDRSDFRPRQYLNQINRP